MLSLYSKITDFDHLLANLPIKQSQLPYRDTNPFLIEVIENIRQYIMRSMHAMHIIITK